MTQLLADIVGVTTDRITTVLPVQLFDAAPDNQRGD